MHNITTGLNQQQQLAVTAHEKHLLILAGAGSGKTLVLVRRIAWLIAQGLATPHSILAVTFTNKAAQQMRERIEQTLAQSVHGTWIGTFHATAHRMLRKHHDRVGLSAAFQILDSDDQKRLIKRIMLDADVDIKHYPPKDVQHYINHHKEQGLRSEQAESNNLFFALAKTLYQQYEKVCQKSGLVDFAELILSVVELLETHQDIRTSYKQQFSHLLVDEFQDTNRLQYRWMQLIASDAMEVTVVGDDDQSIYGWRGAEVAHILNFHQQYPDCRTIRLEQNYRSTGTILQLANGVIAHNPDRLGKNLWTEAHSGDPAQLFFAFNDNEEADFVTQTVNDLSQQGYGLSDIAILYRSNALSRIFEERLIRHKVPYQIYGGYRFYDRMEIKNALSYLRLVHNEQDDTAFERAINMPPRGIGKQTLDQVRGFAHATSVSLWQATHSLVQDTSISSRARHALQSFIAIINDLKHYWCELRQDEENGDMLAQLAESAIQKSGLRMHYMQDKSDPQSMRLDNLEELISACHEYGNAQADGLVEFLSNALLDTGELQAETGEQALSMMTIHASKGLEFRVVFLVGLEEGLFPHDMSMHSQLEEERRLCYVAITRARERLYMSHCESRLMHGKVQYNRQSRFVREMPQDCLHVIRPHKKSHDVFLNHANTTSENTADTYQGYALGTHVVHPTFGDGTIIATEGTGERLRLQIQFHELQASKWILASFSKLIVH